MTQFMPTQPSPRSLPATGAGDRPDLARMDAPDPLFVIVFDAGSELSACSAPPRAALLTA